MKVFISSDHGGWELKNKIVESLTKFNLIDIGPEILDKTDDYPVYALELSEQIKSEIFQGYDALGILLCRSGNGMAITANKVKGIRAALCFNSEHAVKSREDDHANILVLAADYVDHNVAMQIVESFLTSKPLPGRHADRVAQITDYENKHLS